ncbi:MAG TPA: carbamoyltransferase HypF [Thermoplasmata archaeon]|jgi:hydrogenase maturation protein HypF|nr:MAG TPA: carbamoyltransferase HypF [Thermoplasmata archaeon]
MYKIFVQGVVQGVGFRPYIYRKAKEYRLAGSVKNVGNGVEIIINDKDFMQKLTDLPPLAKISTFTVKKFVSKESCSDFSILKSSESGGETELPADIFMCDDCLKELRDKKNRRHNYYFITCTNCGPRFTMIEDYPYDRPFTSMHQFKMCPQCKEEYIDPFNRRYHAQTIACKKCGPKLYLLADGKDISCKDDLDTIRKAINLIKLGEVISIKGVGGFHTCSKCDDKDVRKVREMFHRPHKPYALMVKDMEMAERIACTSEREKELLQSPQRPIVVLKKKKKDNFRAVSELDTIGIMLPYTALHYLLFEHIKEPLVMTSCNIPGEPVATIEKIGKYFLTHERRIVNRCDDSVVKVIHGTTFFLRRSRGYTPLPVILPINCQDTIAVGAELNNVVCTTKKNKCYLSQYIGDTSKFETLNFLKDTVLKYVHLTRLKPEIIACDLHPGYNSTLFAKEMAERYNAKLIQVQHHQAHVASVAAEHNIKEYIGIAMDGLGFGTDGRLWGGEVFLVRNGRMFTRIGHLEEQPQLGSDSATIYPKKMLFGILSKTLTEEKLLRFGLFNEQESRIYLQMLHNNFNIQYTTSSGRILDAVSALLGFCDLRTYDGRPAIILESMASTPLTFEPIFSQEKGVKILLTTQLFDFLLKNMKHKKGELAATAQIYLAKGLFEIAKNASNKKDLPIVFSGGVAYNRMISSYMLQNGILVNRELPAGDGGVCYGQAYIANLINNM